MTEKQVLEILNQVFLRAKEDCQTVESLYVLNRLKDSTQKMMSTITKYELRAEIED